MIEVCVHYVVGGQDLKSQDRNGNPFRIMELSRAPVVGELIAVEGQQGLGEIVNVAHARDGTVHAFVMRALPPPYVADAFRLGEQGMPSLIEFEGSTVRELLEFLAQYPLDYPVTFNDRQRLIARAKSAMLILRLDERNE